MKRQTDWLIFCAFICTAVISIAYWGSKAVTAMAEQAPLMRKHIIVIDAGHGGEDGGTLSPNGIPESIYNLSIALRLEKMLQLLGQETKMVRDTDISIYSSGTTLAQKKRSDLKERVNLVNDTKNSVLLSIHQNSYPDKQYHGAQVFYAKTDGSKTLASEIQNAFRSVLNTGNNRDIKPANGIYLMEHIKQTGVLIECGFLSNPGEAKLLMEDWYQKKIAGVIGVTVKNHLMNADKGNA